MLQRTTFACADVKRFPNSSPGAVAAAAASACYCCEQTHHAETPVGWEEEELGRLRDGGGSRQGLRSRCFAAVRAQRRDQLQGREAGAPRAWLFQGKQQRCGRVVEGKRVASGYSGVKIRVGGYRGFQLLINETTGGELVIGVRQPLR